VIRSSQHGFVKKKLCLTNLGEVIGLIDDGRAVHDTYLNFSKAFNILFHHILIEKLTKYGLDKQTVRWIESH